MDCTTLHTKIHAWLDGELVPAEARAMAEHVGTCRLCARRVRELTALFDALDGLPGPGHAPGLVEATMRAARAQTPDTRQWWRSLPPLYKGAGVAAMAAGLLLGIFLYAASPLAGDSLQAVLGLDSSPQYVLSEVYYL